MRVEIYLPEAVVMFTLITEVFYDFQLGAHEHMRALPFNTALLAGRQYTPFVTMDIYWSWWAVASVSALGCASAMFIYEGTGHEILLEGEKDEDRL
ncbi:uncharacterized protein F4812DRAFT_454400 [Daldinia caldariorum]|uniref:uncharacterized protein n=1 Tax=Daldinia caldariorum TaxID=326644 RepID=UPI0020082CB4|nr:uncharacterized protein F4812DRAFT_454400 [Daldinia caldariorum]KAI1472586.1 hypothetical protein F4812DRAFT_454400 [Daldinia caldariorum]